MNEQEPVVVTVAQLAERARTLVSEQQVRLAEVSKLLAHIEHMHQEGVISDSQTANLMQTAVDLLTDRQYDIASEYGEIRHALWSII